MEWGRDLRPAGRLSAAVLLALACVASLLGSPTTAATAAAEEGAEVYHSDGSVGPGLAAYAAMMAIPSADTGYVPSHVTPADGGPSACPPRRCLDRRLHVPPDVRVSDSAVRVLLPRGYRKKKNRSVRYPVVYLLNGALSPPDAYTRFTALTSMSKQWKAIFVMPEGGHGALPGMFSDWADGSFDWETFHIEVVLPWVDRRFRTIPGGRAVAGLSMGGLGALLYAQRHPRLFKAVFSMSGVVDTNGLLGNSLPPELAAQLGLLPPDLSRVWGNPLLRRANWSAHNPTENVARLKDTLVLLSSGTGFPQDNPNSPVHSGWLEQVSWNNHRSFFAALVAERIPFQARVAQGGLHAYPWFNEPLRWGIPKLIAAARG